MSRLGTSGRLEDFATARLGGGFRAVCGLEVPVVDHAPATVGFGDEAGGHVAGLGHAGHAEKFRPGDDQAIGGPHPLPPFCPGGVFVLHDPWGCRTTHVFGSWVGCPRPPVPHDAKIKAAIKTRSPLTAGLRILGMRS